MESINADFRLPRRASVLRILSLARALLALVGLTAVLAVGLPASRESLLRHANSWPQTWDGQAPNVSSGTIVPEARADAREREQRTLTEYIAKRYRVAQDAVVGFVSAAYRAGGDFKVDPLLILAVMAIESRYNPVAESPLGAKGLMQVIPKFHQEKLVEHGGETALLDPEINIQVGARILREYLRRFGETGTALQMYAGADEEAGAQYAGKVLAERTRLQQTVARAAPRP